MNVCRCLVLAILAIALWGAGPVRADRVALVIGNGAYEHTAPLANPRNDAQAVAARLEDLGFEVTLGLDLGFREMGRSFGRFVRQARSAEVSLVFYAGHGLQVAGRNYLVPVDARLADEVDLPFEAVNLSDILEQLERATATTLVFLDACRDNPLAQSLARTLGPGRSAAVSRGLARVETAVGSLVAYATEPGNVALDGRGPHSPYTAALLNHIATPGLSVSQMLIRVRREVVAKTNGRQVPWENSSLMGDFFFLPQEPVAARQPTFRLPGSNAVELAFWSSIAGSDDPRRFLAYLERYPDGAFAPLARFALEDLSPAAQGAAEAEASQTAEAEAPEIAGDAGPVPIAETPGMAAPTAALADAETAAASSLEAVAAEAVVHEGIVAQTDQSQSARPQASEPEALVVAALPPGRGATERGDAPAAGPPVEEPLASAPSPAELEADIGLDRSARRLIQRALNALGHESGVEDGLFGPATRGAIGRWQAATQLPETGYLSEEQSRLLVAAGRSAAPPEPEDEPAPEVAMTTAPSQDQRDDELFETEVQLWQRARDSLDLDALESYLDRYPEGEYAGRVRILLKSLRQRHASIYGNAEDVGLRDQVNALRQTVRGAGLKTLVAQTDIVIRLSPDRLSPPLGTVQPYESLMVALHEEDPEWMRVRLPSGREGYVEAAIVASQFADPEISFPGVEADTLDRPSPLLSPEEVRQRAYEVIMNDVLRDRTDAGIRNPYRELTAARKALAACVTWNIRTPRFLKAHAWSYRYSEQGHMTTSELSRAALAGCRARSQHQGCTCTLIDENGRNALELPPGWLDAALE